MQVSFNPNYKPSFTAVTIRFGSDIEKYLTALAKKPKLEPADIQDIYESIERTKAAGRPIMAKGLEISARAIKFIK